MWRNRETSTIEDNERVAESEGKEFDRKANGRGKATVEELGKQLSGARSAMPSGRTTDETR